MENNYYIEVQRINKLFFTIIIVFAGIIPIISLSLVLYKDYKRGELDFSFEAILVYSLVFAIILFFTFLKLETKITPDGILFRLSPLTPKFKKIPFNEIHYYCIRKYNPLTEYGGWGIRLSIKGGGIAYTISGTTGLQLYLNSGKKVLIGTRQPDSLISILNNFIPNKNIENKEKQL